MTSSLYRPLGLNFWTSFAFLASSYYAYVAAMTSSMHSEKRRMHVSLVLACIACFATSILNHGTYNKYARVIDISLNSTCFVYFTVKYAHWNFYYLAALVVAFMVPLSYSFLSFHHTYGVELHSLLHIIGNIGIMLMIRASYATTDEAQIG